MDEAKPSLAELLDRYRSIEDWNARYLARWIAVTADPGLRGGLRSVLRREVAHAEELAIRLRELGGEPRAEIPAAQYEQSMAFYGSAEVDDGAKLGSLVEIFREPEQLLGFVTDAVRDRRTDEQTRELLRTILDDERATIDWVRAAHANRAVRAARAG